MAYVFVAMLCLIPPNQIFIPVPIFRTQDTFTSRRRGGAVIVYGICSSIGQDSEIVLLITSENE